MAERNKKYFDPARIDEEVKMRLAKLTHEDILKVIKKNREFDRKQAKFDNRYFSTPTKTTYAELKRAKNQLRKQFKEEAKYRFEDKFLEENEEYLKYVPSHIQKTSEFVYFYELFNIFCRIYLIFVLFLIKI